MSITGIIAAQKSHYTLTETIIVLTEYRYFVPITMGVLRCFRQAYMLTQAYTMFRIFSLLLYFCG
jgi:hypothetical protein